MRNWDLTWTGQVHKMAVSSGPGVVNSGLVFAYDMANREKSFLGAPATNTCSFGSYSYVWANGVVTRNTTAPVPPPITGYEIAKLQSTDGSDTQTILYTAGVDQVNGGVYTHSAWIYLESGTWASVGQHWNPWDYGTWQYITPGRWTRISYTLTNSPNNYGNVALSYNTNGTIYITASQYEKAPFMGKFIGGAGAIRTNTQNLLDLTGQNTITTDSLTYNTDGTFQFDYSSAYLTSSGLNSYNWGTALSVETWLYHLGGTGFYRGVITNGTDADRLGGFDLRFGRENYYGGGNNGTALNWHVTNTSETRVSLSTYVPANQWKHVIATYDGSTSKTYVDGVLFASAAQSGTVKYSGYNSPIIGRSPGTSEYFDGKISLVRLYNRALTADEVAQNFAATRSRYGI